MTIAMTFEGDIFSWRGPAPFLFVSVPEQPSREIKALSSMLTYGWGVIPVKARTGKTTWTTSLFPKDGRYLLGVKVAVQKAEGLREGDRITVTLEVG